MEELQISEAHLDIAMEHCRRSLPNEACGMMGGLGNRVMSVYELANSNPSPVSYTIDPMQQIKVLRELEAAGHALVAIYHSHPQSPALPSLTDINRAFFPGTRELNFPGVAYVIVGLSGPAPVVNTFVFRDKDIERINLKVLK